MADQAIQTQVIEKVKERATEWGTPQVATTFEKVANFYNGLDQRIREPWIGYTSNLRKFLEEPEQGDYNKERAARDLTAVLTRMGEISSEGASTLMGLVKAYHGAIAQAKKAGADTSTLEEANKQLAEANKQLEAYQQFGNPKRVKTVFDQWQSYQEIDTSPGQLKARLNEANEILKIGTLEEIANHVKDAEYYRKHHQDKHCEDKAAAAELCAREHTDYDDLKANQCGTEHADYDEIKAKAQQCETRHAELLQHLINAETIVDEFKFNYKDIPLDKL